MMGKWKETMEHLEMHMSYPASKKQIVAACNRMEHVPKEEREWFAKNLPDRTYKSAAEVKKALKM